MCEDVLNYLGSKVAKKKAPLKSTKDSTMVTLEDEARPKSLKDQIIASLILILTGNDLPSLLGSLNQIKNQLSNS